MDKKLPVKGDVFGEQVVLYRLPVEKYPRLHRLAGRNMPPKVWVRCSCEGERAVTVKALRCGSERCISCTQRRRLAAQKLSQPEFKKKRSAAIVRATKFIWLMGMARTRA